MKKESTIRKKTEGKKCPFGLPVPLACENAGEAINHMAPLDLVAEDKKERTEKANKRVYIHYKTGKRCPYAQNIIKSLEAVNCDYGDYGEGMSVPAIGGSPLYAQTFSGIGLDGLYAYPIGFYADNQQSRNLFHGLFSLVGTAAPFILKKALLYNNKEEVINKIHTNTNLNDDDIDNLRNIIKECIKKANKLKSKKNMIRNLIKQYERK